MTHNHPRSHVAVHRLAYKYSMPLHAALSARRGRAVAHKKQHRRGNSASTLVPGCLGGGVFRPQHGRSRGNAVIRALSYLAAHLRS